MTFALPKLISFQIQLSYQIRETFTDMIRLCRMSAFINRRTRIDNVCQSRTLLEEHLFRSEELLFDNVSDRLWPIFWTNEQLYSFFRSCLPTKRLLIIANNSTWFQTDLFHNEWFLIWGENSTAYWWNWYYSQFRIRKRGGGLISFPYSNGMSQFWKLELFSLFRYFPSLRIIWMTLPLFTVLTPMATSLIFGTEMRKKMITSIYPQRNLTIMTSDSKCRKMNVNLNITTPYSTRSLTISPDWWKIGRKQNKNLILYHSSHIKLIKKMLFTWNCWYFFVRPQHESFESLAFRSI